MFNILISAARVSAATLVLCGLIYPLAVTGVAQLAFPDQANGSLVRSADGVVQGSLLIGQEWNAPWWFHGRPSATTGADPDDPEKTVAAPYNAASSGGSNYGPTSKALVERLAADRMALEEAQPDLAGAALPADMLTTSASGLDPEISPANADLQVARIAQARPDIPEEQIRALVRKRVADRDLGLFGEPRVNVLALNLALQKYFPESHPGRK